MVQVLMPTLTRGAGDLEGNSSTIKEMLTTQRIPSRYRAYDRINAHHLRNPPKNTRHIKSRCSLPKKSTSRCEIRNLSLNGIHQRDTELTNSFPSVQFQRLRKRSLTVSGALAGFIYIRNLEQPSKYRQIPRNNNLLFPRKDQQHQTNHKYYH